MLELFLLLGTVGAITAVIRGSDYPEQKHKAGREAKRIENKKEEKELSSSVGYLSVEKMNEIIQRVYDKNFNLYYSTPKSPTIINNYNFTTVHSHVTVNNHNTYNYFDHCSFKTEYNFFFDKCPHCGK